MNKIKQFILSLYSYDELFQDLMRREKVFYNVLCQEDLIIEDEMLKNTNREKYEEIIRVMEQRIEEYVDQEKIDSELSILKSYRKIITLELAHSKLMQFTKCTDNCFNLSFPYYYIDEKGTKYELYHELSEEELTNKYVVESPYDTKKWMYHLNRTDELDPSEFKESGRPDYYPELNLILQGAGSIHRTAEAFLNKRKGRARVNKYDDTPLFDNIVTDGAKWINKHTNEPIGNIQDFRLALIFEIRRREKLLE